MSDYNLRQLRGAFAAGFQAAHGVEYPTGDPARRKALQQLNSHAVRSIVAMEPEIGRILEAAKHQKNEPGYNRIERYYQLRNRAACYVGWKAKDPLLKTTDHYDTIVGLIGDLLPADDVDLYPEGKE